MVHGYKYMVGNSNTVPWRECTHREPPATFI